MRKYDTGQLKEDLRQFCYKILKKLYVTKFGGFDYDIFSKVVL